MKKNNLKRNLFSLLIASALFLSNLSGPTSLLIYAEEKEAVKNELTKVSASKIDEGVKKQKNSSDNQDIQQVTTIVDTLFDEKGIKLNNTQAQLDEAKQQVMELTDGDHKTRLMEKVVQAQEAYNDNQAKTKDSKEKIVEKVSPTEVNEVVPSCTVHPYVYGDVYMTGNYKGIIKQFKLIVGDKEYTPGFSLLPNNQFKIYIGNKIPPSIFSVTLKSFDEKGKGTSSQSISVQAPKLTINNYTLGENYVRGEFVGDIAQFKLRVSVKGSMKEYAQGFRRLANNQFEVYVKDKIVRGSIRVVLIALNSEGTILKSDLVKVYLPFLVTDYYKLNDDYITGTYTGNVKKFKLIVDNKEYFPGFKLLTNNQFQVYAKNKIPEVAKSITLIGIDEQGNEIVSKKVPIIKTASEEALMVVNNLFEENRAKIGNTQAQINVAKQKVVRLPDSEQKTALLEKVAQTQQAYDTLMKIWEVANSTIENYFINGEIGNPKGALTTEEMVDLSQKLNDLPYRDIKILEGYTTNELWAKYDQLITVSSAIPSVEELFTNDKPSPNNTQDQINISLHLVNQLVDGPCKQKLLAKVQEAQQAYDATHSGTKNSTEK